MDRGPKGLRPDRGPWTVDCGSFPRSRALPLSRSRALALILSLAKDLPLSRCLALALVLGLLAGCGLAPRPANELTIGVSRDLVEGGKDPYFVHRSLGVWESLTTLDDQLAAQPELVESWEQAADGLSWTFRLRPDVKFQDGSPLDAAAVKLNIDRFLRISPRPSPFFTLDKQLAYGDLESVEAVDPLTVRFRLRSPSPALPNLMANFFSAILAPASFGPDGEIVQPIGSGPFKLGDWKRGESAELIANSRYRGGPPTVERVRVRVIPDPNARAAALRANEVDALVELGAVLPDLALELRNDPNVVLKERPIALGHYLFFNGTRPPFDDPRLREAVALAINREALVRGVMHGYGRLDGSLLGPLAPSARPLAGPTYDPERAASLARVALSARQPVTLLLSSGAMSRYPYKAIGEVIQAQLVPLGFDVELKVLDAPAYTAALKSGEYHLSINTQGWPNGDPDFIYRRYLHSRGQLNLERSFGFADPRVDRLIDEAVGERHPGRRLVLYAEVEQAVADRSPVSPLFFDLAIYATRRNVSDLEMDVTYRPSLWKARKS